MCGWVRLNFRRSLISINLSVANHTSNIYCELDGLFVTCQLKTLSDTLDRFDRGDRIVPVAQCSPCNPTLPHSTVQCKFALPTHDSFAQLYEQNGCQWFGIDIRLLILGGNWVQRDLSVCDVVAKVVVLDI